MIVPIGSQTVKLTPDADGVVRVPISVRYTTCREEHVILDGVLQAVGLVYLQRPPSQDYELWQLPWVEL